MITFLAAFFGAFLLVSMCILINQEIKLSVNLYDRSKLGWLMTGLVIGGLLVGASLGALYGPTIVVYMDGKAGAKP